MLTPSELVFTFGGSYVSASFGENRSRNATYVRNAWECSQTGTLTHWQTQTGVIICSMLYAIAMGQITISNHWMRTHHVGNERLFLSWYFCGCAESWKIYREVMHI